MYLYDSDALLHRGMKSKKERKKEMAASSSYLVRAIVKKHTDNQANFAGTYSLLCKSKTMPSPVGTPSNIEATTLEDDSQTFVPGVKTADQQQITGNLEKEYLQAINGYGDDELDIFYLYGTDGVGGVAKYVRTCMVVATPSDTSVDAVLEMTITVTPTSSAVEVTDNYTVTDNGDGTFTVTAA